MNDAMNPRRQRLLDLLAAAAMGPLADDEMTDLESLRNEFPKLSRDGFDVAAAAAVVAMTPRELEPLPTALRQRIELAAPHYISPRGEDESAPQSVASFKRQTVERADVHRRREFLAWCVTAASVLIAAIAWLRPDKVTVPSMAAADLRAALLRDAEDVIQVAWQPGKHPFADAVGGDVVWSDARQQGYLRFTGMPVNDPSQEQYQLWIIDPSRDTEPVDGGVFDVTDQGETVVPIAAKLRVTEPQAFAITIEQPGGVVVSTQEALPLLAPVPREG